MQYGFGFIYFIHLLTSTILVYLRVGCLLGVCAFIYRHTAVLKKGVILFGTT